MADSNRRQGKSHVGENQELLLLQSNENKKPLKYSLHRLANSADATREQNTSLQGLSVYRRQCHCCEVLISYSDTLPITDVVQWILKESTLLTSCLLFLPKELADGLKRNTPFSSTADEAWFTIDI